MKTTINNNHIRNNQGPVIVHQQQVNVYIQLIQSDKVGIPPLPGTTPIIRQSWFQKIITAAKAVLLFLNLMKK